MNADNVGIEAAKVGGRGSGGDSSESLVLCPPTVETAEELEGSFSLPSGSAKATPQATEAASCSQAMQRSERCRDNQVPSLFKF